MLRRALSLLALASAFTMMAAAQDQYVELRVMLSYQIGTTTSSNNTTGAPGVDAQNRESGGGGRFDRLSAMQITIQVLSTEGGIVAEGQPNGEGVATFRVLGSVRRNAGPTIVAYRVRVYGPEIEEQWAEGVQPAAGDRVLMMTIRRKGEKPLPKSPKGIVSATGLTVPKGAQKELDKGNKALVDNQMEQAKLHFTKAIELYPQFDQAYNNLGVVLIKTGDTAGGKKAFEKALELNDKFARAYVNLAKIELQEKQYEPAILLLNKSLSVEPLNAEAISAGCQAYLLTSRYEDVVVASHKLHGLPHDGMALCHFAAGVALANLKRPADAVTEYNLYLNEAKPSDALVSKARDAIEELNKQAAAGAAR